MEDNPTALPDAPVERRGPIPPWISAAAATLFALVALFSAKPAVHWAKGVRARHFAAQSEAAAMESKWQEAFTKAQAAYQLKSDEPDAIRAMAHLFEKVNPRAAVPFLRILAGMDSVTPRDLSEYAEACLNQGNLPEARTQVGRLLQMEPSKADNLRLAARIHGALGDIPEGLRFAQEAEQADPQNLDGRLLAARLQILSTDPSVRKAGWDTLWDLGHGSGATGLESLHILTQWNGLPASQADELAKLLRDHPLSREQDRLTGSEVELRFHPEQREKIIDEALAKTMDKDGEVLKVRGAWLNGLGEYKRTLDLLPEKLAASRQDFFLVYLDALAALNRWSDVSRLLAIKDVPLADVYIHAFNARAAEMAGKTEEAEFEWRRAQTAATGNAGQIYYLAQYAEKMGKEDQAVLAYQTLAQDVPTALLGYQNLLRLAQARGDAEGARVLMGDMMKQWQDRPEVRNDYAYLNVLLGKNLVQARDIAFGLVSALPAELPHRTTLALALLRLNDPVSALNVYSGLNIPWDGVSARDKAIFTAVLGANGRKDEAGKMAATIPLDGLFKEERALVTPWLPPARSAASPKPIS